MERPRVRKLLWVKAIASTEWSAGEGAREPSPGTAKNARGCARGDPFSGVRYTYRHTHAFARTNDPREPKRSSGPLTLIRRPTCCTSRRRRLLYSVVARVRSARSATAEGGWERPRRRPSLPEARRPTAASATTTIRVSVVLFLPDPPCAARSPRRSAESSSGSATARRPSHGPPPPPPRARSSPVLGRPSRCLVLCLSRRLRTGVVRAVRFAYRFRFSDPAPRRSRPCVFVVVLPRRRRR